MIKKFHESQLDEKFVRGENIFDGNLLHLKRDEVSLPNGRISKREYICHPGAVAVVPITDDGRIVLVKQCRYPLDTVMWEIPAGKLDHGSDESIEECAKRELSEETGYETKQLDYLCSIATTPGFSDEIIHLFSARHLVKYDQHTDEDEFIDIKAFTKEEIRVMICNGELYDAKSICAFYALDIKK